MWAAAANRVAAVKLLVAKGADIKATSRVDSVAAKENADRAIQLFQAKIAEHRTYIRAHGEDMPEVNNCRWGG